MSTSWIPQPLRELVRTRAGLICEYCLIHEEDTAWGLQVDHVISEKHHGPTADHNLALACAPCNRAKGSDVSTIIQGKLVRLYHPRIDRWSEHFCLHGSHIRARSRVGAATIRLLGLNETARLELRSALLALGSYPSSAALKHMD